MAIPDASPLAVLLLAGMFAAVTVSGGRDASLVASNSMRGLGRTSAQSSRGLKGAGDTFASLREVVENQIANTLENDNSRLAAELKALLKAKWQSHDWYVAMLDDWDEEADIKSRMGFGNSHVCGRDSCPNTGSMSGNHSPARDGQGKRSWMIFWISTTVKPPSDLKQHESTLIAQLDVCKQAGYDVTELMLIATCALGTYDLEGVLILSPDVLLAPHGLEFDEARVVKTTYSWAEQDLAVYALPSSRP